MPTTFTNAEVVNNRRSIVSCLILETVHTVPGFWDKKADSFEVALTINGVEVDVKPFFKIMEKAYDHSVVEKAKELINEKFDAIIEPLRELRDQMKLEIVQNLQEITRK